MVGLDTNVLVRYIVRDDPAQAARADACIEGKCSRDAPGFIAQVVLVELVWVLARGYGYTSSQVREVLFALLTSEELMVDTPDVVNAALTAFASSNADFADCLIGAVNSRSGCSETWTFDRKASRLSTHQLIT